LAEAMRPEAPPTYRPSLIERLGWHRWLRSIEASSKRSRSLAASIAWTNGLLQNRVCTSMSAGTSTHREIW
jgi:hypothetical protein